MVISLAIASQKHSPCLVSLLSGMFVCLFLVFSPFSLSKTETRVQLPLTITGDFRPGGLLFGHIVKDRTIYYRGEQVSVNPRGQFVIGLDRDHEGDLTLRIAQHDGSKAQYRFVIRPREYQIQSIKGVAKKYVSPDPQQLARTRAESARARSTT